MKVFGVFGELIQGYVYNREIESFQHFLFTLPVKELYSKVSIETGVNNKLLDCNKSKSRQALELLSTEYNINIADLTLTIDSNIPIEKGHASSTADIVATCKCFFYKFVPNIDSKQMDLKILKTLKMIEYSDYLLHDGITSCYQRDQKLIFKYQTNMKLKILGIDENYLVNTEEFHRINKESIEKVALYEQLRFDLHNALISNNFNAVGHLATKSAIVHNNILPKKYLSLIRNIQLEAKGLGICVAHSGSLIGIIFSEYQDSFEKFFKLAQDLLYKNKLVFKIYTVLESNSI